MRKPLEDDELDRALAQPLSDMPDGEFSHRITAMIAARRMRSYVLELVSVLVAVAICLSVLPVTGIDQAMVQLTSRVADSLPLLIALAAIALSFAGERILRE